MSNYMDHKTRQAIAEELANDLKTPADPSQLSAFPHPVERMLPPEYTRSYLPQVRYKSLQLFIGLDVN
jgi:hypothetical protein